MRRFGPDPQGFFEAVYEDVAPWDIGGVQPAMAALLADYPPVAPILDVGCGTGDVAIHLAGLGYEVVGIDIVEAAIAKAEGKRAALPAEVRARLTFRVADGLRPSALGMPFGSVVDSGFLHLLDPDESDGFIGELRSVLRPGGRYYLHAFAVEFAAVNMPRAITDGELRRRFTGGRGWRILDIRPAEFYSRVAPPVAAIAACIERL